MSMKKKAKGKSKGTTKKTAKKKDSAKKRAPSKKKGKDIVQVRAEHQRTGQGLSEGYCDRGD